MTKTDELLLDLLERRDPNEFDRFMAVVGQRLEEILPTLRWAARSFGANYDPDEVLSAALERGVTSLYDQFRGKKTTFVFSRQNNVTELNVWLLCVIGRPGAGKRSGLIGTHIQRIKRERTLFVAITEDDTEIPDRGDEGASFEELSLRGEKELCLLRPQEQFIFRLGFGLHDESELGARSIAAIASRCGFPAREVNQIRRRAAMLFSGQEKPPKNLSQKQIGAMLDISDRQVGIIKAITLTALRQSELGMQIKPAS